MSPLSRASHHRSRRARRPVILLVLASIATLVPAAGTLAAGAAGGSRPTSEVAQAAAPAAQPQAAPAPITPLLAPTTTILSISTGATHTCAVMSDGKTYCWGANSYGQLGDNSTTTRSRPVEVALPAGRTFTQISAGFNHTCAIADDGSAWCWGSDTDGRLGIGANPGDDAPLAVTMPSGRTFIEIAAGNYHTCALDDLGDVWCWGDDTYLQLGNGATSGNQSSPVAVTMPAGRSFTSIGVGDVHSCGLADDGTSWCWGYNGGGMPSDGGQVGDGTLDNRDVPTATTMPASETFTELSVGSFTNCALNADGDAWCWGYGASGQVGDGNGTASNTTPKVVDLPGTVTFDRIAPLGRHTCAVGDDGNLYCWGWNFYGQLGRDNTTSSNIPVGVVMPAGKSFGQLASGVGSHACAVATDVTVWCWGAGGSGQVGDGSVGPGSDRDVPTLIGNTLIVKKAGMGRGDVTSTPAGVSCDADCSTTTYSSFGPITMTLTATADAGTASSFSSWSGCTGTSGNDCVLTAATGSTTATVTFTRSVIVTASGSRISAGDSTSCAIVSGAPWCWGYGGSGEIGDGDVDNETVPSAVSGPGATTFVYISSGSNHTCALTSTGGVWCWGTGGLGRLGDGSDSNNMAPASTTSVGKTFAAVSAGFTHSCAVATDGTAWCWGSDSDGQLGNGATSGNQSSPVAVTMPAGVAFTRISAGGFHTCALDDEGDVWCWGRDDVGMVGNGDGDGSPDHLVPTRVTMPAGASFVRVDAGMYNSCAIDDDDDAWCWGSGLNGLIGDGDEIDRHEPTATTMPSGRGFTWIDVAMDHVCATDDDGDAWCWGTPVTGALGITDPPAAPAPAQTTPIAVVMPSGRDFTWIAAGHYHSCASAGDGTFWCWGPGSLGQIGDGAATQRDTPVLVGNALTVNKTGVGRGSVTSTPPGVSCAVACLSTTYTSFAPISFTLAATADVGNGSSFVGWTGDCTSTSGSDCVLTSATGAKTVTAGFTRSPSLGAPGDGVHGGQGHTCGLQAGVAYCWGAGYLGQIGNNAFLAASTPTLTQMPVGRSFHDLSVGGAHSCALATDGTAWCWGWNGNGQLGDGTNDNRPVPTAVQMPPNTYFVTIATGGYNTCAIDDLGAGWCWGGGGGGRNGDGTETNRNAPRAVTMPAGRTFLEISVGNAHACARADDGTAWCWGYGGNGNIGDGAGVQRLIPTQVTMPTGRTFTSLSAHGGGACAVANDATAWCWGANVDGQIGDGTGGDGSNDFDRMVPTAVTMPGGTGFVRIFGGTQHACALTLAGAMWCWGSGLSGQLGHGVNGNSPIPIAVTMPSGRTFVRAGLGSTSCAHASDGTSWCWGAGGTGQIGDGWTFDRSSPTRIGSLLTVTKAGTGTGTVTSTPAGLTCGALCTSASLGSLTALSVTLTATPAAGSSFAGWSGDCTGTGACVVTGGGAYGVTATFALDGGGGGGGGGGGRGEGVRLRVRALGLRGATGRIVSEAYGIDCSSTCFYRIPKGSVVTLTAMPGAGSSLFAWSDACGRSTATTCTITLTKADHVGARFRPGGMGLGSREGTTSSGAGRFGRLGRTAALFGF